MAGLFSRFDAERIVAAIAKAEKSSSGEIRVHLTSHRPEGLEERAVRRFQLLGMDRTRERNGVLIYVAPRSRKFRIIGDVGIHEKCGPEFWTEVAAGMQEHFRRGEFTEGVVHGVERVGDVLARHFPRVASDRNELPDEVTSD
jgi:uncharacterized membrane protein